MEFLKSENHSNRVKRGLARAGNWGAGELLVKQYKKKMNYTKVSE